MSEIRAFPKSQGHGIWVHPSELIVHRFQLETARLNLTDRKRLVTPDGGRFMPYPPTREEAYLTIMASFDTIAINLMADLSDQYEIGTEIIESYRMREIVRQGIEKAIFDSLDVQFPFLRDIEPEIIKGVFEYLPYAGREEDIKGTKEAALDLLDTEVLKAQKLLGSEWTKLQTDHDLPNRIAQCIKNRKSGMDFSVPY